MIGNFRSLSANLVVCLFYFCWVLFFFLLRRRSKLPLHKDCSCYYSPCTLRMGMASWHSFSSKTISPFDESSSHVNSISLRHLQISNKEIHVALQLAQTIKANTNGRIEMKNSEQITDVDKTGRGTTLNEPVSEVSESSMAPDNITPKCCPKNWYFSHFRIYITR